MNPTEAQRRELDCWIAKELFNWTDIELHTPPYNQFEDAFQQEPFWRGHGMPEGLWREIPHYTTDPAASRELERKIVEKCGEVMVCYNGMYSVHCAPPRSIRPVYGPKANTLELAFALLARKLAKKLFAK